MEPNENVPTSRQCNRQGKRKILIERQLTDKKRNATFSNRREGLLRKARELAMLCGVDVTLIMFTPQGELYEVSSNTKAHVLYQYLKKREQEGHTDPELVALYYKLAHVEALEHEANRNKYNLELHRVKIDPRLRKFTVKEMQIMSERNLLNKFKETLQNNQKAILEFYEKRKNVGVSNEPVDKEKAEGNFPIQPEDFVQNYQPPQVPQETLYHRSSRYVNEATPLTMDGRQDPQRVPTTPGPPRYVANRGQYQQFQHQVHTRHHEAYNMPQQTMVQQPREFELLVATMKRERELLRRGESSPRKEKVVGHGGSSQGDIAQVGFVAPRFIVAQGPQGNLPNNQNMQLSHPYQTQHNWRYNQTRMNFGHDSWPQHTTTGQPSLEQQQPLYQPPIDAEPNQGQDSGAQRPQEYMASFQNMYPSHPDQVQENDEFFTCGDDYLEEQDLEEIYDILEEQVGSIKEQGNYQRDMQLTKSKNGNGEVGAPKHVTGQS